MKYKRLIRPLLFLLPPEVAHSLVYHILRGCYALGMKRITSPIAKRVTPLFDRSLINPVGIAAGFDKQGKLAAAASVLQVGFIELGTFTPKPQPGNPRPRLFRAKKLESLVNRMGFNNPGIEQGIKNLQKVKRACHQVLPCGISIAKNNDTPAELLEQGNQALADYIFCLQKAYVHADYIAINISCPNVPNHRSFWQSDAFCKLVEALAGEHQQLAEQHQRQVPLLIKISPDLSKAEVKSLCQAINQYDIAGVIACNTTVNTSLRRPEQIEDVALLEKGGLSGPELFEKSVQVVSWCRDYLAASRMIIGVGGINSAARAQAYLEAGANAVQIYTGLIYEGPELVNQIINQLESETEK